MPGLFRAQWVTLCETRSPRGNSDVNKDDTTELNVQGLGPVLAGKIGDTLMVSLNDVLNGIGKDTPAKVVITRAPSVLRAKIQDGRNAIHMVDVAAAVTVVASSRGIAPERILTAVTGLLEAYAKNAAAGDVMQPEMIANMPRPTSGDSATGYSVPEVLRQMGLHKEVHAGHASKFVSENYKGERDRCERGVVFADKAQVARLLQRYAGRRKRRLV